MVARCFGKPVHRKASAERGFTVGQHKAFAGNAAAMLESIEKIPDDVLLEILELGAGED